MTDLTAALDAFKPQLADQYRAIVRRTYDGLVAKFGDRFRGVYNDVSASTFKGVVLPNAKRVDLGPTVRGSRYELDEARLAHNAARYADETVAAWRGKIDDKVGELDAATVRRGDGAGFVIVGTRDGRKVRIEQDMILNVSSRGLLFNQFPARIYVDGKFTSAAAYKRLFA